MQYRDTTVGYGVLTRLLHWVMALAIFFLFALGWWMVTLEYYSPYYRSAPDFHRSLGVVVGLLLIVRFAWRLVNIRPCDQELGHWERRAARVTHWTFYPLILAVVVSGYLISTSDGRAIDVFGLFSIPSIVTEQGLEDIAGYVHRVLAYGLIGLAVLHSAASLKHHFVDRSTILRRMISGPPEN